jgi:hypothetical protein
MKAAHNIWLRTYGAGQEETAAMAAVDAVVRRMQTEHDLSAVDSGRLVFAVQWLHGGCVQLTTGLKFGAALCASSIREEALSDVELPAKAFRVLVPEGLLHSEKHKLDVAQINVCVLENGQSLLHLEGLGPLIESGSDAGSRRLVSLPVFFTPSEGESSIARLLADKPENEQEFIASSSATYQQSPDEMEARKRVVALASRLVGGLLLTYTHTTHWRASRSPGRAQRSTPRAVPRHRTIFIGRPMDLDVRPAIYRFLGGGGTAPSVQSLVRGHHKRQVVGVGRSGRRVIWIEPYWRGPEDAPILARPYRVGGAE